MKSKTLTLFILLAIFLGMATRGQAATLAAPASEQEPPLRDSEPVGSVVADLGRYIPEYMRDEDIPGVAIALIRDGEVVWTEGFGVTNAITRRPVAPETLFEVASNSKVVTAYIALRLVDQGVLSLDEPLDAYLPEPWLPPSEYRDAITLRHVLSHSSGLGHSTLSRDSLFAPSSGYYYSAIGFQYLQAVIEQVTGQSLEDVAREMVFGPLGMSSSSFVNRAEIVPRTANGHLRAVVPVLLFVAPFAACFVVVGLVGLVILRVRTGGWRPARRMVLGTLAAAFVLTCLLVLILIGAAGMPDYAWLIVLCGLAVAITFAVAFLVAQIILARMFPGRPGRQRALTILWSVIILVGLVILVCLIPNVPVPKSQPVRADAAGTVRATARDLAVLLIELADPQYLSADTAAQMRTSQVSLTRDLSWGLGPGIQHSRQGDALWQWGQWFDFQSVMVIYPERGFGVVVLTNSDALSPDVAIHIAHRALGGKIEPLRRASHLEFNYRGPYLDEGE